MDAADLSLAADGLGATVDLAAESGAGGDGRAGEDGRDAGQEVTAADDADAAAGPADTSTDDAPAGGSVDGPDETFVDGPSDASTDSPTGVFVGYFETGAMTSLRFEAGVGQGVEIRAVNMSSTELGLSVSDPGGQNLGTASGRDVAAITFRAHTTGTYTINVFDALFATAIQAVRGTFKLYLVVAPGTDNGGTLTPGGMVSAHLDEGELDSYTFAAQAGQAIALRMADVTGGALAPWITVYDPLGAVVGSTKANEVASVEFQAQSYGTYTVVLGDSSNGLAASGDYTLYFITAPGANEGSVLAGGDMVAGHLDEGALESYSFLADVGQGIMLRVVDLAGGLLAPGLTVYDPTGVIVGSATANDVAAVEFQTHSKGTYTVVLGDSSPGFVASGDYNLYFAIAPGANKGGPLPSGGVVAAHLDEGALDSYTFVTDVGHWIMLRMVDVAGGALAPGLTVYDPTGAVVQSATATDVAGMTFGALLSGTYTVVLWDSSPGLDASGDYNLYFTIAPGSDSKGTLTSAGATAHLDEGALDSYVFDANVGDTFTVEITNATGGSFSPTLIVYDPAGSDLNVGPMISFQAFSKGAYTVIVYDPSLEMTGTGDYQLSFTLTPATN
jgi:hypothetical protein